MNVYIIGTAEYDDEFLDIVNDLAAMGHDALLPAADLRLAIAELTMCEAVHLADGWWTDAHANMLQTIAAWLHLTQLDRQGMPVKTVSLRG